jgi:hypothetical protein
VKSPEYLAAEKGGTTPERTASRSIRQNNEDIKRMERERWTIKLTQPGKQRQTALNQRGYSRTLSPAWLTSLAKLRSRLDLERKGQLPGLLKSSIKKQKIIKYFKHDVRLWNTDRYKLNNDVGPINQRTPNTPKPRTAHSPTDPKYERDLPLNKGKTNKELYGQGYNHMSDAAKIHRVNQGFKGKLKSAQVNLAEIAKISRK